MLNGTYLVSPNGNYRFYFANGMSKVYDISNWDRWVERYELLPAYGNPGFLMYSRPNPPNGLPSMHLAGYDSGQNYVVGFGVYPAVPEGGPVGQHFMRLEDDGCMRFYDQDGNRWIATLCG
jgi:hypothetical protein